MVGAEELLERQRDSGRLSWKGSNEAVGVPEGVKAWAGSGITNTFIGYDHLSTETVVLATHVEQDGSQWVCISSNPFYAEGGGQVADTGVLEVTFKGREYHLPVVDCQKISEDCTAIHVQMKDAPGAALASGTMVLAAVDRERRARVAANHT
ncbi:alaS, partial [Symbiodinium sp. KB8]